LGRNYLDEEAFRSAGIRLVYQDYVHPTYRQAFPGFVSHLSAIDVLFNCGSESREVLLKDQTLTIQ
jgi:hypothetical protein